MKHPFLLNLILIYGLSAGFVSSGWCQQSVLEPTVKKTETKKMPDGSMKVITVYSDGGRIEKETGLPKEPKVRETRYGQNGQEASRVEEHSDKTVVRTLIQPDGVKIQRTFNAVAGTKDTLYENPDGSSIRVRVWVSGAVDTTIRGRDGSVTTILERVNGTSMERTANPEGSIIIETHYGTDGKPVQQIKNIEGMLHRQEETSFKDGVPVKTLVKEGKDEVLKNFEQIDYDVNGHIAKRIPLSEEAWDLQETALPPSSPAHKRVPVEATPESKRQLHE